MLNFENKSDVVFSEILTASFDIAIDELKYFGQETLESRLPNAAKVFSVETAIKTLERLRSCHQSPGVFDLNDYHYILIYDALESYCKCWDGIDNYEFAKGTKIHKVDFDAVISIYFPDIDFLLKREHIASPDVINHFSIRSETLSVVFGRTPGGNDLENKLLKKDEYSFDVDEKPLYTSESTEYPDWELLRPDDEYSDNKPITKEPVPAKIQKITKKLLQPSWNRQELPKLAKLQKRKGK